MSEKTTPQRTDVHGLPVHPKSVRKASGRGVSGTSRALATDIETCDSVAGLSAIHAPGTGLVIWKRTIPLCLRSWIDGLDPACLPDLRLLVGPSDLRRAMAPELDDFGMPAGRMRDLLVDDVAALVAAFAKVVATDLVDIRLECVTHDACWKFHRDCVEARFLTTYRGPGTEWIRPAHAEQALREQRDFNGPIERIGAHDGLLFKGSSAGPGIGIVHRSPPIEGTGGIRLLLCLNKPSVTSPPPWSWRS